MRDYIARENPAAAERLLEAMTDKIEHLAAIGCAGVPRDHLSPGLCAFVHRGRCIYFYVRGGRMVIARVLHGAMDVTGADVPAT